MTTSKQKTDSFPIHGYGILVSEEMFNSMYLNYSNLAVIEEYVDSDTLKEGEYHVMGEVDGVELRTPTNILLEQLLIWQGWDKKEAECIEYIPTKFFTSLEGSNNDCVIYIQKFDENLSNMDKRKITKDLLMSLGFRKLQDRDIISINDIVNVPKME